MENYEIVIIVACYIGSIILLFTVMKKVKVHHDREEIKQEIAHRATEIEQQNPEKSVSSIQSLCQDDLQLSFMQHLLEQIEIYSQTLDTAVYIALLPFVVMVFDMVYNPSLTDIDQIGKQTKSKSISSKSTTNKFMPEMATSVMSETNSEYYLARHLDNANTLSAYLQQTLIDKCISMKPSDQWNLLKNLQKMFAVHNISDNERNHVIMAALNIYEIKKPQIGLITNRNYNFSETARNLACYLAEHCLVPDTRFNPVLDVFKGLSNTVGGQITNSNQFLDRLEGIQKSKQRGFFLWRYFG